MRVASLLSVLLVSVVAVLGCEPREPPSIDVDPPSEDSWRDELARAEALSRRAAEEVRQLPRDIELDARGHEVQQRFDEEKARLDAALTRAGRALDDERAQVRREVADATRQLDDAIDELDAYSDALAHRAIDAVATDDANIVRAGGEVRVRVTIDASGRVDVERSHVAIERIARLMETCPTARYELTGTGVTAEDGAARVRALIEALRARGAPVARVVDLHGVPGANSERSDVVVRVVRACSA